MEEFTSQEKRIYIFSYLSSFPLLLPKFVNFGLTHRCNFRCKICSTYEENPKIEEELNLKELKKLIAEVASWSKKINVSFAGGEPLIRKKDLLECIRYACKNGLTTHVTTNGALITNSVAKEIVTSGLNYLQISLDGIKKEINDYMRDENSFKSAMAAIKHIKKWAEKMNSSLKLSLTTVVTNKNLDQLLDIYYFAKEQALYEVAYNPYTLDNSYTGKKSYENDEFWVSKQNMGKLKKICKTLIELKRKEGKVGTPYLTLKLMPEYFEKKGKFKAGLCLAGYSYMYIKPNGDVDVCGKGPSLNVRKLSLKGIWYSPQFAKTRLKVMKCRRPCLMLCFPRILIWGKAA